jgi:hypothetical protein
VSCQAPNRSKSGRCCGQAKGSSGVTLNSRVKKANSYRGCRCNSAICYGAANSDLGTSSWCTVLSTVRMKQVHDVSHQAQAVSDRTRKENTTTSGCRKYLCVGVATGGICRREKTRRACPASGGLGNKIRSS